MDKLHFDRTDYSVVVKNRAPPPSSWKWEIYRAGRSSPVNPHSPDNVLSFGVTCAIQI
jgi:hypothetical protein